MSLRFIPPRAVGRYAVFVDWGNENGFFKVYNNLGAAKGAARHHTRYNWDNVVKNAAKILEMVDGEWYVLYDIPKDTKDLPWYKEVYNYHYLRGETRTMKAQPLTADEYAEFRVTVTREQAGLVSA